MQALTAIMVTLWLILFALPFSASSRHESDKCERLGGVLIEGYIFQAQCIKREAVVDRKEWKND